MLRLQDICRKGASTIAQKDLEGREGCYPIYGASGFIKNVDFYQQESSYVAVVKDGAGVGRVMKLPAKSSVIGTMQYIIPNEGVDVDYLAYVLEHMDLAKYHTGATIPHIYFKDYCNEELPNHTADEQRRIAEILLNVDNLISLHQQQLVKLDALVKSRFIELFGDPVVNTMGWNTDTVNNICRDIYGGGTPSKAHPEYYENGDIPWVSSKDMKTDILYDSQIKINQLGVDNSTAKMVPVNSVIMVIRSGILKHTLPVAINAVPITVNQDLKVFIPSNRILPVFLLFLFKMLEKDILTGVRAVTADNIEFNTLKERLVIVPPIELQAQFAAFVEQTDKSKLAIQESLAKLETLKKSLMQQYFG